MWRGRYGGRAGNTGRSLGKECHRGHSEGGAPRSESGPLTLVAPETPVSKSEVPGSHQAPNAPRPGR